MMKAWPKKLRKLPKFLEESEIFHIDFIKVGYNIIVKKIIVSPFLNISIMNKGTDGYLYLWLGCITCTDEKI